MRTGIVERIFTPKKASECLLKPVRQMVEREERKGLQGNCRYEWQPKNPRSQTKFDTFVDTREGISFKPEKDETGNFKAHYAQIANGNESMLVDIYSGDISKVIKRPFFSTASGFLKRMQKVVDKLSVE